VTHDNKTEKPAAGPGPPQAPLGLRTTPLFFRQVLITHFFLGPVLRAAPNSPPCLILSLACSTGLILPFFLLYFDEFQDKMEYKRDMPSARIVLLYSWLVEFFFGSLPPAPPHQFSPYFLICLYLLISCLIFFSVPTVKI
jgi:hypothetical protein